MSREAWSTPGRDLLRRFTRRGRATLRAKRVLVRMVRRERRRLLDLQLAEVYRREQAALQARFDDWDDRESDRIREELLDDLEPLYPGTSRAERRAIVREFRTHARDLPVVPRSP